MDAVTAKSKDRRGVRVLTEFSNDFTLKPPAIISSCFAGDCSRVESLASGASYDIERRDLQKRFRVLVPQKKYQTIPLLEFVSPEEKERFVRSARNWNKRRGRGDETAIREFHIRIRYEKTSDEAVMFGCTANRWVITRHDEREAADDESGSVTNTEAWYFDHNEFGRVYPPFSRQLIREAIAYATTKGERAVLERVGDRPSGLCAKSTNTTVNRLRLVGGELRENKRVQSSRITSITEEGFPKSMFEPPAGYSRMPVYPSRFTVAKSEALTNIRRWGNWIERSVLRSRT